MDRIMDIVKELVEEYKGDKVNQLAMMYAQSMYIYGVDVTKAWETAVSQCYALNKAYLRGLHDEQKYQYTQMKNNGGWIPCSERLPEESGEHIVMIEGATKPTTLTYNDGTWFEFEAEYIEYNVVAWQPLPEPYIVRQQSQKGGV